MANQNINNMSVTWNDGGTTFDAIKMNVTNAASAAASKLLNMQVGGTTVFSVDPSGDIAGHALTLTDTGAGATAAPLITLYRNSASPAASDILGKLLFQGEDSAGNTEDYAEIYTTILDPTSTSEDASILFRAKVAGTMTTALTIIGGVIEDTFTLADPADTTKRVRIDAGGVGAGQTRVIAAPNADITLPGAFPTTTVDNTVPRFDGTAGSFQTSGVTINDANLVASAGIAHAISALTIASGAITVTGSYHRVDTESAAASDDLDTINGGVDGQELTLRTFLSTRDVVVKHGTGNISLVGGTDFTLAANTYLIRLHYDSGLTKWREVARAAIP